jgi:hypothetical protein
MISWLRSMHDSLKDRSYRRSFILGWLLLFASVIVSYYAGIYATKSASNAVTDIVLSNVPVFDLDGVFLFGPVVFWLFVTVVSAIEPRRIPFMLKSIALFVVVRSAFIVLTHIGPFPTHFLDNMNPTSVITSFMFGGDLFFSGHTGLPFLVALIYWDQVWLRRIFVASAVFFGVVVLLAHLHYSIDVLSAFFITYSIYHIAIFFFKKDYELFLGKPPTLPAE